MNCEYAFLIHLLDVVFGMNWSIFPLSFCE